MIVTTNGKKASMPTKVPHVAEAPEDAGVSLAVVASLDEVPCKTCNSLGWEKGMIPPSVGEAKVEE